MGKKKLRIGDFFAGIPSGKKKSPPNLEQPKPTAVSETPSVQQHANHQSIDDQQHRSQNDSPKKPLSFSSVVAGASVSKSGNEVKLTNNSEQLPNDKNAGKLEIPAELVYSTANKKKKKKKTIVVEDENARLLESRLNLFKAKNKMTDNPGNATSDTNQGKVYREKKKKKTLSALKRKILMDRLSHFAQNTSEHQRQDILKKAKETVEQRQQIDSLAKSDQPNVENDTDKNREENCIVHLHNFVHAEDIEEEDSEGAIDEEFCEEIVENVFQLLQRFGIVVCVNIVALTLGLGINLYNCLYGILYFYQL